MCRKSRIKNFPHFLWILFGFVGNSQQKKILNWVLPLVLVLDGWKTGGSVSVFGREAVVEPQNGPT